MSEKLNFEKVKGMVAGLSRDEAAALLSKDNRLKEWISLDRPTSKNGVAVADGCSYWIYDPDRGWVCADAE
ncbi:MAG: hypothetical protein AAF610_00580 [Pseudomonadota bacterium]